MVINKIGNINNIIEPQKSRNVRAKDKIEKNDSINISIEGKQAAEIAKYQQIVSDAPDVRADKVATLKEQIENGTYDFDDIGKLEAVASKISSVLLAK